MPKKQDPLILVPVTLDPPELAASSPLINIPHGSCKITLPHSEIIIQNGFDERLLHMIFKELLKR